MNINDITLLTVTFNNNILTGMMLKSFHKQIGYFPENVLIIDNGTSIFTDDSLKSIFTVIDNHNQKLTKNYNQCSKNHCSTIDYALKQLIKTKFCLLVDNDILFKPSIKILLDSFNEIEFDCLGEIGWDDAPPNRLFPYLCLINVEKFNKEKLNYFDNNRCIGPGSKIIGKRGPNTLCWYKDTGYSFLEDITKNNWNINQIKLSNYIVHLKGTTFKSRYKEFLANHKDLF